MICLAIAPEHLHGESRKHYDAMIRIISPSLIKMNSALPWMIEEWIDVEVKSFLSRLHHPERYERGELENHWAETEIFIDLLWNEVKIDLPPIVEELVYERMEMSRCQDTLKAYQYLDAAYWCLEEYVVPLLQPAYEALNEDIKEAEAWDDHAEMDGDDADPSSLFEHLPPILRARAPRKNILENSLKILIYVEES